MLKQSSCGQLWEALKCCSHMRALIPEHPCGPTHRHSAFPVSRSNKLQSVDILKRLHQKEEEEKKRTIFCLPGESCSFLRWVQGELSWTLPAIQLIIDALHAKDTSCPAQPSKLLKAPFSSGNFFIWKFWEQTPQPSQVLLSIIHHPRFQLTEHLQGKPQLGTVFVCARQLTEAEGQFWLSRGSWWR